MIKVFLTLGSLRVVEASVELVLKLQWSVETADSALTFGVFTLHWSLDYDAVTGLAVGEAIALDGPEIQGQLSIDKFLVTRRMDENTDDLLFYTVELTTVKIFYRDAANVKAIIPVPAPVLRAMPASNEVLTSSWADGTECYHSVWYDKNKPGEHRVASLQWQHAPFLSPGIPGFSGKCPHNCGALPSPANCGVEPME